MDGLFNYQNPQALQQQYLADRQLSAAQMAQLPLLNQVAAMGGNTGAALGTSLGRLFGGRTAAEVENEAMKEIFTGAAQQSDDPVERMTIAAKGLRQRGLEGRAIQLEQEAAKLQQTRAATRKTEADMLTEQQGYQMRFEALKKRFPNISDEEARAVAQDEATFREVFKTPNPIKATVDGRVKLFDQAGNEIANLGAAQETGTRVDVRVDSRGAGNALGIVRDFDSAVKVPLEAYRDAQMAKTLINESMNSNNSQAWEQSRTLIAKAAGQGKLSNEDIRRTGVDPRFVQGVADWINKKTVGVPNEDIRRQLYIVASHLERQMGNTINQTAQRARNIAEMEGVDPAKLDTFFPGVSVNNSPRRSTTGGSGTVNWSDLK